MLFIFSIISKSVSIKEKILFQVWFELVNSLYLMLFCQLKFWMFISTNSFRNEKSQFYRQFFYFFLFDTIFYSKIKLTSFRTLNEEKTVTTKKKKKKRRSRIVLESMRFREIFLFISFWLSYLLSFQFIIFLLSEYSLFEYSLKNYSH